MSEPRRIALTIAGSDSSAGAGIQADLKTFAALGVYGASAITALTAQNTRGVKQIEFASPGIVGAQIEAIFADFEIGAIKIGMLGTAGIVIAVAHTLRAGPLGSSPGRRVATNKILRERAGQIEKKHQTAVSRMIAPFIVYDPVLIASSGDALGQPGLIEAIKTDLLPLVDCLTPNLAEAAALLGAPQAKNEADMARQAQALRGLGPAAVLLKGGHLSGDEAVDVLATDQGVASFRAPRIASRHLHGTGCTLASAIAAYTVLGLGLPEAISAAKRFVSQAVAAGRAGGIGSGAGPLLQIPLHDSAAPAPADKPA